MNGANVLLDIKTGPIAKWVSLQTAAYAELFRNEITVSARYGLELKEDGKYSLTKPYMDQAGDWDVFTTHSYYYAAPTFESLGAGSVLSYWLDYQYSTPGRMYVDVWGTDNNYSWYYIGLYYI